ncbi:hypothetical protein BS78_08G107500 [Paspalum vaginatum]|nr:hypothetical protein BS78_08G107500 [Paspalum vaginatum]KAJ1265883.1 hypothetical protein BS78_08G107500 [Paspalum vaginatum]
MRCVAWELANWGHFRNCVQSMAHYLLSAGQMMGKQHPPPGAALSSLNSHPSISNGPEDNGSSHFSSPVPFHCRSNDSSHCFCLSPHIIPRILVAEITPCSSLQHSFIPCITLSSSVLTHGLSRRSNDHDCRQQVCRLAQQQQEQLL